MWSPVLIDYTDVREAQEGKRREAGDWGNKLCWETNKCTVNEGNNKMSHKKSQKKEQVFVICNNSSQIGCSGVYDFWEQSCEWEHGTKGSASSSSVGPG